MVPGLCEMKSEMKLKMGPIEEDIVQLLFAKTRHNGLKNNLYLFHFCKFYLCSKW